MKKIYTLFLIFSSFLLFSCKEDRTYKIGISQCSYDDWRAKMNGEIEREGMFHPELEIEIRSADGDSYRQIEDIRFFVENDVDLLIVSPNEAENLTPLIKEVYDQGIPVLVFDRGINGEFYTAFHGADNYDIGRSAADYVLNTLKTEPVVLEVFGLQGSTPAEQRHDGFFERLEKSGTEYEAQSVDGDWTADVAFPRVVRALHENPEINVIFAHNDRMAIAASEAARTLGLNPLIIGIDAMPEVGMKAVHDGVIDATFLYPTEGTRLLNTALAILEGHPYEKVVNIATAPVVTKDNVDALLMQNEELVAETIHLEELKEQLDGYWVKHNAQRGFLIAVIIILLLSFGVIFSVLKAVWIHKRNRETLARQNLQLEEQKNELIGLNAQLSEATQSKLMFFTNVSHDLRTPITLISEPVSELAQADNLTDQQQSLVKIADKNIRILRRLINQILDFRKYEHGKLKLTLTEVDLERQLSDWLTSFLPLARKRHISLKSEFDGSLITAVDVEKMERVFFNLVSNAFKYSPDNADIKVVCRREGDSIVLSVTDTGRGIPPEEIANVFELFFQVEKVHPTGSGIGLSLTKAFVEMHGGTISVESEQGKGSRFTVKLPVIHVAENPEEIEKTISVEDVNIELGEIDRKEPEVSLGKPVLLLIDDNTDILNLASRLLDDEYVVLTASNGLDGLKLATKYVPDIIVCDVMMPVMDGLECCAKLKDEATTSHIPVLMLTACAMDEQRVQGFESGADGYLSKPFNLNVLKAQLRNLIKNRRRIKSVYLDESVTVKNVKEEPRSEDTLKKGASGIDNEFYHRFVTLVKENMSDPDLSVDWLASEMGLARTQFYRKIKSVTNFSPVEMLRSIRLKEARRLLTATDRSISEIGFDVGFSSAAYFSKCFHDEFGETPSQLRERLGHG